MKEGGKRTKNLILKAINQANSLNIQNPPNIFVDSGTENLNQDVDDLVESEFIKRTVAQIDVEFSNSMIESLFHRMKHRFLFLKTLTEFNDLEKYVDEYLADSNNNIPLEVLKGGTPFEVITGNWDSESIRQLSNSGIQARNSRRIDNLSANCGRCIA